MRHSIATVSISGMLHEKLQSIAAARFDGVEIFENDLLQFSGTPADVRRIAGDLGLTIDLFQPFRDFEGVGPKQFQRNLERAERKFELMQELGAPLLLVCSNAQPDVSGDVDLIAEQLYELAQRAAKHRLRIGFEALAWGTKTNRFAQAYEAVRRANHPHLGLILDSFHTLALRDDPEPIAQLPGDKIFFVQLADAPWVNTDVLSFSRHYRCFPGQGEFALPTFLGAVLDSGYGGPLSLEIFNDEFRAAPSRPTASDAKRSLLWLEEHVRDVKSLKTGVAHGASHRFSLFDPPPTPRLTDWSFVEFAVDARAALRLASFFETIGFVGIGRHRSKAVELFGQSGVRIILNSEPDSFARSYFELHGASVCATAFATADAATAIARAEAFGLRRVAGNLGADELTIPAVRAPDGGLVHFFDLDHGGERGFERDFIIHDPVPGEHAHVTATRIDHIAQVVPGGQLDTWTLFYRAVLGLRPVSSTEMHDPYGVIRSRALESSDRAIRYALNVSERDSTSAARTVANFGGAGVHHVAFNVGDVLATARTLRRLGAPLLPIPVNYYDDLAAKYDLEAALLDELQEFGVLYDRNKDGEFMHVYTTPFDDRFFFEFVERRAAYHDYGTANAPVRLAALAEWRMANGYAAHARAAASAPYGVLA
jgi:4-hydroxyphenylpyruvate dioxygenase